eukprot:gene15292-18106_t
MDVYLLIEVGTGSTTSGPNFIDYIDYFTSKFQGFPEGIAFGFGIYSYSKEGPIVFKHMASFGSNITQLFKSTIQSQPLATSFNDFTLFETITKAASASLGFREGAFRTITLCGINDSVNSTNDTKLGFGSFSKVTKFVVGEKSGRWADLAYERIKSVSRTPLWIMVGAGLSAKNWKGMTFQSVANGITGTFNFTIENRCDSPAQPSSCIRPSNVELNILSITFNSIPSVLGSFQLGDGSTALEDTPYHPAQEYQFLPKANANGEVLLQYTVDDGCLSTKGTVKINIKPVNDIPTCQASTNYVSDIDTPVIIELKGEDVETASSAEYPSPTKFQFKPFAYAPSTYTNATFSYKVIDGISMSAGCNVAIRIGNIIPPVISAITPHYAHISSTSTITLTAFDFDTRGIEFHMESVSSTSQGGLLFDCLDNTKPIQARQLLSTPKTQYFDGISTNICYQAPSVLPTNPNDYVTVVFYAVNNQLYTSNQFSISISIVDRPNNHLPITSGNITVSTPKGTISQPFSISGLDTDTDDISHIKIKFSHPNSGDLILSDGSKDIVHLGGSPLTLQYRPDVGFVGNDSVEYWVIDPLGAISTPNFINVQVKSEDTPPSVSITPISIGQFDNETSLVVESQDHHTVETPVTCTVLVLPTRGSLMSDQSVLDIQSPVGDNLRYRLPTSAPISDYQATYTLRCCDGYQLCTDAIGEVNYKYINTPPEAIPSLVETIQGVNKQFTFSVKDEDNTTVTILLGSLPLFSVLTLTDGTEITTTLNNDLPTTLIYCPDPQYSNKDTPDGKDPLDQIVFYAVDKESLSSPAYAIVKFSVIPKIRPIFNGDSVFETPEDTNITFILGASASDISNNIEIIVTDLPSIPTGNLFYWTCPENSCLTPVSTGHKVSSNPQFTYFPPRYMNGDGLFTFSINMTSFGEVVKVDITINVTPVNNPPVIQFVIPKEPSFTMEMDSSQVIKWSAIDIDSGVHNLVSQVNYPSLGKLYEHDPDNKEGGYVGKLIPNEGDAITLLPLIEGNPIWLIVYVPEAGAHGQSYTSIGVKVKDDQGGETPITLFIPNIISSPTNNSNSKKSINITALVTGLIVGTTVLGAAIAYVVSKYRKSKSSTLTNNDNDIPLEETEVTSNP